MFQKMFMVSWSSFRKQRNLCRCPFVCLRSACVYTGTTKSEGAAVWSCRWCRKGKDRADVSAFNWRYSGANQWL